MDLDLTGAQRAFRDEVRGWLSANVPREPLAPSHTETGLAAHRAWERHLAEAGYAAIHWPAAYGGRDADLVDVAIFQEEYARAGAPDRLNVLALGLVGPTLIDFGTEEQRLRWLPGMLSCEAIWCQGFSEPEAGSDLANVRTTAVADGDGYRVNGQKTWTSLGRFGDWILALVRTRPPARGRPKHDGLSMLVIDLHAEGVEVRPIVQINEDPGFAEIFFTDVAVPADHVVGAEHDGWRVAMTTLGHERATGLGSHVRFSRDLDTLVALAQATGLDGDPLVRDALARRYVETEVFRHHTYRTLTRLAREGRPGPEASLNKLYWSEMEARIYETGADLLGPLAELGADAEPVRERLGPLSDAWERWRAQYWYARASMIYAGTSEIQKNIIAQRVLGLPRS